jgi:hypothetical protein
MVFLHVQATLLARIHTRTADFFSSYIASLVGAYTGSWQFGSSLTIAVPQTWMAFNAATGMATQASTPVLSSQSCGFVTAVVAGSTGVGPDPVVTIAASGNIFAAGGCIETVVSAFGVGKSGSGALGTVIKMAEVRRLCYTSDEESL